VGAGAIGQAAVLALTQWGARVAIVDPSADRRELALSFGAEKAIWAEGDALTEAVRAWADGYGAELVIDATGAAAVLDLSISLARKTATVLVLGLTSAPATIHPGALPVDELRIQGSSCALRADIEAAVRLVEQRAEDVRRIYSHRYALDQAVEAFEVGVSGSADVLKVLVEVQPAS